MLRKSAAQGDEMSNPAVKLIEYFEKSYGVREGFEGKDITFETTAAQRDSAALRSAPKMIDAGYVRMFLDTWLQQWSKTGSGNEDAGGSDSGRLPSQ